MKKEPATVPKQLGQMAVEFAAIIHEMDEKRGRTGASPKKSAKKAKFI